MMPEVDDSHNAERRENLRWDAGAYRRPRRRCEACTQTPRFPAFGPLNFIPVDTVASLLADTRYEFGD